MKESVLIGICGGSGSGKTTLAKNLQQELGPDKVGLLFQDSFYHDQSQCFDHDGGNVNFDHPSSLDFHLMFDLLTSLKKGNDIELPVYDFQTHSRLQEKKTFKHKPIVLVDGILLFSQANITELLDHKIFVDTPEDTRLSRRIERDINERGRTKEGVLDQFYAHVKPMHDKYIEPFKEGTFVISGLISQEKMVDEVMTSALNL